ncbi:MAG: hypothetical protein QXX68_03020 [Candidatus Pacearchaeota archaeon]
MKFLIFDSGPLISLTLSGLLDILPKIYSQLKETKFIITPQVKFEVIDKSKTNKKFSLEAFKIEKLIHEKVFSLSSEFVSNHELSKETQKVLSFSKQLVKAFGHEVQLIQEGEASCIAFAKIFKENCLIVSDERTVRLISESKEILKEMMEKKLHSEVFINNKNFKYFEGLKYIRSSELVFYAFEKGLIDLEKSVDVLDALLYSLKFHGTAISNKEIEEAKEIFRKSGPRGN